MKDFIILMRRFVPPYTRYLVLNIVFNILATILSLFSFSIIIPLLQILFKIDQTTYQLMAWDSVDANLKDKIINNVYYYLTLWMNDFGPSFVLMILGAFLVVATFLKTGATYLALYNVTYLRTGIVRDIRNFVFTKVTSLPIGFFTNERKGDIMARITGDVSEIENSVTSSLDMMFRNPIMILVYFCTMLVMSWQLTLFVLILLPISGYIMGKVGKNLKRSSFEAQTLWGQLMSQIEETLGGLRVIKAFNAEGKINKRFVDHNQRVTSMNNRIVRRQSLAHPMSEFLGTATIACVLWYGGKLILNNDTAIDAATFIYYLIIFYSIINPAKEFSRAAYQVQRGLAAMQRVDLILAIKNPIQAPAAPVAVEKFSQEIRFNDLSFSYADKPVLSHINLVVPKGKTVALVGQSGSGKSTLVDLIPRFYDPQQGAILIDGVDIRQMNPHALRHMIGNVNQEAILFNDTIYNNIAFGVENTTPEAVEAAARIANAHDFILATEEGYNTMIGDRGCRLSGGQRQRLSIARAVLKNPPILILDEATSALDTESERLVQDALENLMRNRTSIVIAHRLSTIKSADLICVLHEGEIIEQGSHDELMSINGAYRRLVSMQSF